MVLEPKIYGVLNIKLNPLVKLLFWSFRKSRISPLLSLFPSPLLHLVVAPIRVSSTGQADVFRTMFKMILDYIYFKNINIITKYQVLTCVKWCIFIQYINELEYRLTVFDIK